MVFSCAEAAARKSLPANGTRGPLAASPTQFFHDRRDYNPSGSSFYLRGLPDRFDERRIRVGNYFLWLPARLARFMKSLRSENLNQGLKSILNPGGSLKQFVHELIWRCPFGILLPDPGEMPHFARDFVLLLPDAVELKHPCDNQHDPDRQDQS
jgi:hypothetical protein